jgi:AAA domain
VQTLATAFSRNVEIGVPLPEVYPSLTRAGIKLRRSQVVMLAAQPGNAKSTFALNLAVALNVPTLYFSADTDDYTTSLRAAAALSGSRTADIERDIKDEAVKGYYEEVLNDLSNLWCCFTPEPTVDDMALELDAFQELFGSAPELIIVDNLVNVTMDSDNEWSAARKVMKLLMYWARTTHACVLVLHHCQESAEYPPGSPPPRRAIQGKLSQLQSLILTCAVDGNMFKIACVKNRHGPYDATGETYIALDMDLSRMQIKEREEIQWLKFKEPTA